jgi:hypothetical protein
MNIAQVKVLIELLEDISFSHITIYIIINYKMSNRKDINQKTEFNKWSISYLTEIFQCSRCRKRNTIVLSSNNNQERKTNFQNCLYCGNPNYIK